jgi:hypothetical protein
MNRTSSVVEFYHNGEELKGTLFTYFNKAELERGQSFMFNYKGTTLHIDLDEDEKYYDVAPLHCKVIDKLGLGGYKKYEQFLSDIDSIKRNYIVVNNKVYNYFSKCISSSPKYYMVNLKLSDGTNLEYNFREFEDRGNKNILFKNLQYQANAYYNNHHIEPSNEQLNEAKTQEYQEKINWINELHESL